MHGTHMSLYEVRVWCSEGFCNEVMEYMENNGYEHVRQQDMPLADHFGILKSDDIDTAVAKSREIKRDMKDKVLKVKLVPLE
ncbi:MAG: hypothetical protein EB828_00410 [Nitrosopumilus sp. D6]|nr:MAG: hypothetical protein EB828_00410 [Nitrosopumilus sp. D6]